MFEQYTVCIVNFSNKTNHMEAHVLNINTIWYTHAGIKSLPHNCHMFPHHCHISSHHRNTTAIYSFTTGHCYTTAICSFIHHWNTTAICSFTTATPLPYVHSPLQHHCHMFIHHCNTTTIYSFTTATPLPHFFTPVPQTAPHALLNDPNDRPTTDYFSHATQISKTMSVLRLTSDSMSCASRRL